MSRTGRRRDGISGVMVRPHAQAGRRATPPPATLSDMEWITSPEAWIALLTLTVMEIVLGIDNIVFISVLVQRLPAAQRDRARTIGLGLAMLMRIGLLLTISWIVGLTQPLFTLFEHDFSVRDVILIGGGLFLIWKATTEIHEALEGAEGHAVAGGTARMGAVLVQIVLLDIVFSLDSVLTAVGMADDVGVMITAVVIAVGVMLFASGPLSRFVQAHPTVKMLALSFLLLIGVTLMLDGFGVHVDKAYIYAAMAFSVFVELLNLFARKRRTGKAVELHPTFVKDELSGEPATPAS
jgi:predicted tellurium resistance membrane protein TerC